MRPRTDNINMRTLSLPEAAKIIGISPPTLRRFAKTKMISHVVIGSRIRFTANDVENYISRNTHDVSKSVAPIAEVRATEPESDPFLG